MRNGDSKANHTNSAPRPMRAVAIRGLAGGKSVHGGRGAVADAMTALATARGVEVRKDADLAEILSAMDPATAASDAAAALTAAALDRLYRLNDAAKSGDRRNQS